MLKTLLIWSSIIFGLSLLPYPFFIMGSGMSLANLQPDNYPEKNINFILFKSVLIFTLIYPFILVPILILGWFFYLHQMWAIATIATVIVAFCDGLLILILGYLGIQGFMMNR